MKTVSALLATIALSVVLSAAATVLIFEHVPELTPRGKQGPIGPSGPKGDPGMRGARGATGPAGKAAEDATLGSETVGTVEDWCRLLSNAFLNRESDDRTLTIEMYYACQ